MGQSTSRPTCRLPSIYRSFVLGRYTYVETQEEEESGDLGILVRVISYSLL